MLLAYLYINFNGNIPSCQSNSEKFFTYTLYHKAAKTEASNSPPPLAFPPYASCRYVIFLFILFINAHVPAKTPITSPQVTT